MLQLSPRATAVEPVACSKRSHGTREWSRLPQLGKACAQQGRPSTAIDSFCNHRESVGKGKRGQISVGVGCVGGSSNRCRSPGGLVCLQLSKCILPLLRSYSYKSTCRCLQRYVQSGESMDVHGCLVYNTTNNKKTGSILKVQQKKNDKLVHPLMEILGRLIRDQKEL